LPELPEFPELPELPERDPLLRPEEEDPPLRELPPLEPPSLPELEPLRDPPLFPRSSSSRSVCMLHFLPLVCL